jgi:hypothetical protein
MALRQFSNFAEIVGVILLIAFLVYARLPHRH